MEFLNALAKFDDATPNGRALRHEALCAVVLLLNPITPHVAFALWQALGEPQALIDDVPFPHADPTALVRDAVMLAVQVSGKLRGTIEVPAFVEGKTIAKVIVVPGKIVNIVAN